MRPAGLVHTSATNTQNHWQNPIYENLSIPKKCFSPRIRKYCLYIRWDINTIRMTPTIKFIETTSLIFTLAALFISIIYRNRRHILPIQLYIISCVITIIIDLTWSIFAKNYSQHLLCAIQNIQTVFEIILIYYFFYARLQRKAFRHTLIIFILIFLIFCCIFWVKKEHSFFSFAPALLGVEGLLITIASLLYLYEILINDLVVDLKSNSNFIIACGILFYFSITVPIFFSWYTLYYLSPGSDITLTIINQICFTILIISFMKAYLCPIPNQQQ
jgi:hypothetical protein